MTLQRPNELSDRRLATTTWRSRSSRQAIAFGNADRSFRRSRSAPRLDAVRANVATARVNLSQAARPHQSCNSASNSGSTR
ncbi:MAG: hypothetical protein AAF704_18540 [Cyanobacteria bacterium P01_D01_bin.123]